ARRQSPRGPAAIAHHPGRAGAPRRVAGPRPGSFANPGLLEMHAALAGAELAGPLPATAFAAIIPAAGEGVIGGVELQGHIAPVGRAFLFRRAFLTGLALDPDAGDADGVVAGLQ